jgi:hypothetical protein
VCIAHATYVLNLVLVEVRYPINDDPRQAPAEVHRLVHNKAHDSRRQHIVSHEGVPRRPQLFHIVQAHVVLGDFVEFVPVGIRRVRQHGIRDGLCRDIVTVRPRH